MYVTLRSTFTLLFLLLPILLFSQKKKKNSVFEQEILKKSEKFNTSRYYSKAKDFFIEAAWDSTLLYTMKQLSIAENVNELQDYCHFLRGCSFYEKSIFKEAKNEFYRISPSFTFYHNVKMMLGTIALNEKEFLKAISYFEEIEKIEDEQLLGINKANIEHNIGLCYLHLEKYELAEKYLQKSVALLEKVKDTFELIGSYSDLGTLYYEQYKDTQAIPYFVKAYTLGKTTNDFYVKQNLALNMAIVEENRKRYEEAIQYRKEYEQWKDSVNDQNKIWEEAQLEKQFAVREKQKEVSILKAENKVKIAERNTFLYSALILLILLVTSFYFYREKVRSNKIITAQKENLDELNATKDKLFSIVSHDLRSSVQAIKTSNKRLVDMLETENLTEVDHLLQNNSAIVNNAYNLLDNLLNWALLQTKQSYFEITKLHLGHIVSHVAYNYKAILADKELVFKNNVAKTDIVYADRESLKIILRNLIDNAIKFSKPQGTIIIYSHHENDAYCQLIVEDTGIGMDETTRKELLKDTVLLSKKKHENIIGTGLGMQLCKSMIQKNNGIFSIESELGKGTKIIISLPKKPT